MYFIIKKVPKLPDGNLYTWDTKHIKYLSKRGTWNSYKDNAAVFEGNKGDAFAQAAKTRHMYTEPTEDVFIGPIEVRIDDNGNFFGTIGEIH